MSIFLDQLSELPRGGKQAGVDLAAACRYLSQHYWNNDAEKTRREKAARRYRFYCSAGDSDMVSFITNVIKDKTVQQKRIEFIEHAKFNNVLRRVVHELATVYALPAVRTVAGDENNARYQDVQRRCRMAEVMLRGNRLSLLDRNVVYYPRVRTVNGKPEPVLDLITPDCFDAIAHPLDPTALIALSLDLKMRPMDGQRVPARIVWTADSYFYVDSNGVPFETEPTPHTFGRIPALLFSIEPPAGTLLDRTTGDDLEAAHRSVWFLSILLLKEAKSATKQHVLQGDLTGMARQQAADTDVPIEAPEGTSVSTIDNSMDLAMYLATMKGVFETAAANFGLPPSVLSHSDVQSAEARELQRVPLREIRLQQQIPFRDLERELAALMSVVYKDIPDLAFTPDGWRIDFADPQTPLGTKDALEVFKQERELGLTSTIAELMRRNPDLDEEAAGAELLDFIADELARNRAMRPLQQISGSMGAAAVPEQGATEGDGVKGLRVIKGGKSDLSWVKEVLGGA